MAEQIQGIQRRIKSINSTERITNAMKLFGNGEYTVRYAALHPDTFFVGMEVSPACVLRCAKRSVGLDNLRLVRTDARYMMKELFADSSLDKIYMNFPCPWPKKRK